MGRHKVLGNPKIGDHVFLLDLFLVGFGRKTLKIS